MRVSGTYVNFLLPHFKHSGLYQSYVMCHLTNLEGVRTH